LKTWFQPPDSEEFVIEYWNSFAYSFDLSIEVVLGFRVVDWWLGRPMCDQSDRSNYSGPEFMAFFDLLLLLAMRISTERTKGSHLKASSYIANIKVQR
jgi:hypothetical protein